MGRDDARARRPQCRRSGVKIAHADPLTRDLSRPYAIQYHPESLTVGRADQCESTPTITTRRPPPPDSTTPGKELDMSTYTITDPDTGASTWVDTAEEVPSAEDRKSTRLNSSHVAISYAVFCLKKKNHES